MMRVRVRHNDIVEIEGEFYLIVGWIPDADGKIDAFHLGSNSKTIFDASCIMPQKPKRKSFRLWTVD